MRGLAGHENNRRQWFADEWWNTKVYFGSMEDLGWFGGIVRIGVRFYLGRRSLGIELGVSILSY